jgi:hypothetical protein
MRTNGSLLWMTLAALFPLAGCAGFGGDYLGYGSPAGADESKEGFIQIFPTSLTLRVNERRTVVANLDGPIAYFVRFQWTVNSSSIELTPGACSEVVREHRECPAELTAMASGAATVTFAASLSPLFFRDGASLRVSVVP